MTNVTPFRPKGTQPPADYRDPCDNGAQGLPRCGECPSCTGKTEVSPEAQRETDHLLAKSQLLDYIAQQIDDLHDSGFTLHSGAFVVSGLDYAEEGNIIGRFSQPGAYVYGMTDHETNWSAQCDLDLVQAHAGHLLIRNATSSDHNHD